MAALNAATHQNNAYMHNEFGAGCYRSKTWTTTNVVNTLQAEKNVRVVMGDGTTNTMIAITYNNAGTMATLVVGG